MRMGAGAFSMAKTSPNDLLNTTDAAQVLGLSSDHMRRLSNEGRIPAMRTVAGHRLFKRSDLEELAAERRRNPPQAGRPKKKARKVVKKKTGVRKKK